MYQFMLTVIFGKARNTEKNFANLRNSKLVKEAVHRRFLL